MSATRLGIKVVPNASRDGVAGWLGEDLKVRIQAPPEGGKANARLCRFLATHLGLPKGSVAVVSGHGSARKIVEITGVEPGEIRLRAGVSPFPANRQT